MTQPDNDLANLVQRDPLPTGVPDTAELIRAGSRLRRRRHVAITGGVGLAAAAVLAPFWLLGGTSDTLGVSPADSPRLSTTATNAPEPGLTTLEELQTRADQLKGRAELAPQVCGVMACVDKHGEYGSLEKGEVIGAQLEMGLHDGHMEVLYAARNEGFDTMTGKPKDSVDVISSGIVVDGRLFRTVWAFQPNEDQRRPILLYGGERTVSEDGVAHFGIFGYVEGEHAEITATSEGQARPVSGLSTEVYPGYTLFYDTAAWVDSWSSRADVTYAVPGGASCSVEECGTIG